jgi:hypothetical protein
LHNKPKAEVHPEHLLTGPKEEEEEEEELIGYTGLYHITILCINIYP